MREQYDADFHKPGVLSGRAWLTCGTHFVARRLEFASFAAPLWCVGGVFLNAARFRLFVFVLFCIERTRSTAYGLRHVSCSLASFASLLLVVYQVPGINSPSVLSVCSTVWSPS